MKIVHTPPPASVPNSKVDWAEIARQARDVAPEWVLVDVPLSPSVRASIIAGKYRHIKLDEFELTTRRIKGSSPPKVHFYVRVRQP